MMLLELHEHLSHLTLLANLMSMPFFFPLNRRENCGSEALMHPRHLRSGGEARTLATRLVVPHFMPIFVGCGLHCWVVSVLMSPTKF